MPHQTPYVVLEHFVVRGGILARDMDGYWHSFTKRRHLEGVRRVRDAWQNALTALVIDELLEPNVVAAFTSFRPGTQLTVHDLTPEGAYVLADTLKMPHVFIRKEIKDGRGTYTTTQADALHRLQREVGDEVDADLSIALTQLLHRPGSAIVREQGPTGGVRWSLRLAAPGREPIPLTDLIISTLLDLGLVRIRAADGGAARLDEPGDALVLTSAGRSLASDLANGIYDPSDVRLSAVNFDQRVDLLAQDILYHPYDPAAGDAADTAYFSED